MGFDRKAYQRVHPEGPRVSDKIQGALGAVAIDADTLIIGIIGMEAVSKQLGERMDLTELDRIIGEWHYDRATFTPWARDELARFEDIRKVLDEGYLPDRYVVDDSMTHELLNPNQSKVPWQCTYCNQLARCAFDGPGFVEVGGGLNDKPITVSAPAERTLHLVAEDD
jgi:hypothetical protein